MAGDPGNSSMPAQRKVALVTGASRGIGRAIAVELARSGFDVIINYASNEAAAKEAQAAALAAATDPQARVELCQADISESRETLVQFAREKFNRLDLLVNNAGIAPAKRVDMLEEAEWEGDHMMAVNLRAPYFLTRDIAKWMIEQRRSAADDYRPAIINISSISAYAASPERAVYCISKAGMSMMTQLYAARLADEGINVYEIRPGVIATDMTAGVKEKYDRLIGDGLTPIKRWGTPEDVAHAVVAIAGGSFPFSTGEVINVDGGFHLRRL